MACSFRAYTAFMSVWNSLVIWYLTSYRSILTSLKGLEEVLKRELCGEGAKMEIPL